MEEITQDIKRDKEYFEIWNLFRTIYKPKPLKNQLQCVRCREYDWLSPNGLCGRCIEILRNDFPEIFEQAKQENMKLFDEGKQLYYKNGIKERDYDWVGGEIK